MAVTASDIPEVFFLDGWITRVDAVISSGKEGTVFRCQAGPHTGHDYLAVKIHRDRTQRSFRNDAIYLSGRPMGVALNGSTGLKSSGMGDKRLERAVRKRSRTGIAAIQHSWINHEYNTMQLLFQAGARVPQPFAMAEQALVMTYVGDAGGPAPQLKHAALNPAMARRIVDILIAEITRWLACERIHGDLSPFNILLWRDEPVIIDFPQAVNPFENPDARFLLERDLRNVTTFFKPYGIALDPQREADRLWTSFMRGAL
jgi:RIO kinase 1